MEGMYTSDLAAVAPQLFHLTAGDAWPSIVERGLRSATWLVRAARSRRRASRARLLADAA